MVTFEEAVNLLNITLKEYDEDTVDITSKGVLGEFYDAVRMFEAEGKEGDLDNRVLEYYLSMDEDEESDDWDEEEVEDWDEESEEREEKEDQKVPQIVIENNKAIFSRECLNFICEQFDEGHMITNIAKDIGVDELVLRKIIARLQKSKRLGVRKKGGSLPSGDQLFKGVWTRRSNPMIEISPMKTKINSKPNFAKKVNVEKAKSEEPQSLEEALRYVSDVADEEDRPISTAHKELLIEVIHKLIC